MTIRPDWRTLDLIWRAVGEDVGDRFDAGSLLASWARATAAIEEQAQDQERGR